MLEGQEEGFTPVETLDSTQQPPDLLAFAGLVTKAVFLVASWKTDRCKQTDSCLSITATSNTKRVSKCRII